MPPQLEPVAERFEWCGPEISAEDLPTFEIAHHENGRTEVLEARWHAEASLSVSDLPRDLPPGPVYCVPFADTGLQLEFLRHFRSQGRVVACGTYPCAASRLPGLVRTVVQEADLFFCNEEEAKALFAAGEGARTSPGKLLFITRGSLGARVVQGDSATEVPGIPVDELDPTGAGDTFCGTVLAKLEQGEHPVVAARWGVASAAEVVSRPGPGALLRAGPLPEPPSDPRVRLDRSRIEQLAAMLGEQAETSPFDFTGEDLPPPGHRLALDFFFSQTLQQFGFWLDSDGRYQAPMFALLGGSRRKGSDYLWALGRRWLEEEPDGLTPEGQSTLSWETFDRRCRGDDGANPLPEPETRWRKARDYGRDMTELGWKPGELVADANSSHLPLRAFLGRLDQIGGYKEDPLRKKSALLALILTQRPERFLRLGAGEEIPPVVDYHLQRSCLRMGMVRIEEEGLRARLAQRELLAREDEAAIRESVYRAVQEIQRSSGRSMGVIDRYFFQNRERCPEMTDPDCHRCPADPVCAHEKSLFQPVRRTTFY
jgi:hypothetical protein